MVVKKSPTASGVYQILNLVNGHCYIGQARNLNKRKREHFSALRRGKYGTTRFQNAFNKYGQEAFEFIILRQFRDYEIREALDLMLTAWEQHFFDTLRPEYNNVLLAGGPPKSCQKGQTYEQRYGSETAAKIKRKLSERNPSRARKGKTYEEIYGPERAMEIQQKQSKTRVGLRKGKTYDELYGPKRAAEIRQKLREASKIRWRRFHAARNQNTEGEEK